jgi:hypothetical protein
MAKTATEQMQQLAPNIPVPDLLTRNKTCCYLLLSLVNDARNKLSDNPSTFAEGHTLELALNQLDDCEEWVKGKLNDA